MLFHVRPSPSHPRIATVRSGGFWPAHAAVHVARGSRTRRARVLQVHTAQKQRLMRQPTHASAAEVAAAAAAAAAATMEAAAAGVKLAIMAALAVAAAAARVAVVEAARGGEGGVGEAAEAAQRRHERRRRWRRRRQRRRRRRTRTAWLFQAAPEGNSNEAPPPHRRSGGVMGPLCGAHAHECKRTRGLEREPVRTHVSRRNMSPAETAGALDSSWCGAGAVRTDGLIQRQRG